MRLVLMTAQSKTTEDQASTASTHQQMAVTTSEQWFPLLMFFEKTSTASTVFT